MWEIIPAVIGVASSILGGEKAKDAGRAAQRAKEFQARQLEQQAGQAIAVSQREAMDEERKATLIASRAMALVAAGGGGTSDPTAVNLIADINGEGAYRRAVAVYQGEEQARQLMLAGKMSRLEGDVARRGGEMQQRASNWQAASYAGYGLARSFYPATKTVASEGSSLYSKYSRGGPPPTDRSAGNLYDGVGIY